MDRHHLFDKRNYHIKIIRLIESSGLHRIQMCDARAGVESSSHVSQS